MTNLFLWAALGAVLQGPPIGYPADAGFADAKRDFGARGDGVVDDTASLQKALEGPTRQIFLPEGIYLVSDTLTFGSKKRTLQGAGRDRTVLRLRDHAPGYGDPKKGKPVLDTRGKTHFAQNFFNYVLDLTIEVGAGNPGAVAVRFHTNNGGGMFRVRLRGRSGAVGLAQTDGPGPGLVREVSIEGFDVGSLISGELHSMTFEGLVLEGQKECGFRNRGNSAFLRGLRSRNSCPAVINEGKSSFLILVEADLAGGTGGAAVLNTGDAVLFARDLRTTGYGTALQSDGRSIRGPNVEEFTSHEPVALFPGPRKSLRLPIEDPPEIPLDPPSEWADVTRFSADGEDDRDDTEAIQKAFDSGRSTVFFPRGSSYRISDTIRVRGKVRRILGLPSGLKPVGFPRDEFDARSNSVRRDPGEKKPVFRVEEGESPVVLFERLFDNYGQYGIMIEHASRRTLVVRSFQGASTRNTVPGGKAFFEDVGAAPFLFDRQKVWMRQVNTESYVDNPHILNRGGDLWILGIKTEKDRTIVGTEGGGRTEVLGGFLYKNRERIGPAPAFTSVDSSLSLAYKAIGVPYQVHVEEVRGGEKRQLTPDRIPTGRPTVPLYAGWKGTGSPLTEPTAPGRLRP